MSGYFQRLTRQIQQAQRPSNALRPLAGSVFTPAYGHSERVPAAPEEELPAVPSAQSASLSGPASTAPAPPVAASTSPQSHAPQLRSNTANESPQDQPRIPTHHEPPSVVRQNPRIEAHQEGESTLQARGFAPMLATSAVPPAPLPTDLPAAAPTSFSTAPSVTAPSPSRPAPTPLLSASDNGQDITVLTASPAQEPPTGLRPKVVDVVQETRPAPLSAQRPLPASLPQAEPDEIHIHIGRIEVTAAMPAPLPAVVPAPRRKGPSLAEYLSGRRP